jgi:putative nucleotidyltransferase with HDIG domain
MTAPRSQLAEEMLRRFAAALRAGQLYSKGHPIIGRNLEALVAALQQLHGQAPSVVIGVMGDEIIVGDVPVARGDTLAGLVRRLKQIAVERITIDRGVSAEEVTALLEAVTSIEPPGGGRSPELPTFTHIRVGQVTIEQKIESGTGDMSTFRRMYSEATRVAEAVWESAKVEGQPDAAGARTMVDGLAQAVSQNRTALLALTTLKDYDNYTFTHMVNVSILTMGQARALGIDGPLLREFGLAALMHDIGKVRTPLEILNKPDKLTDEEFAIMKRHPVDGAEILRVTPDIPTLSPIVAFEHHLRLDGTGYPAVSRPTLNLCTMLCGIADVYDAMRSRRRYQKSQPSERILEVLKREDGTQFDRHLVRRFAQLIGIYPPGNLVLLNTGETAVVVKAHAPDPRRPQVKVVVDRDGARLEWPYEISLWEGATEPGRPTDIVKTLDPADVGIDPLTLL